MVRTPLECSESILVDSDQCGKLGSWCIHRGYHSGDFANRYSPRPNHSHTACKRINWGRHGMVIASAGIQSINEATLGVVTTPRQNYVYQRIPSLANPRLSLPTICG